MLRPHLVRRVCRAGKARRTGGAQGDTRGGGSAATRTSFRDPGPFLRPRPGRDAPCSRNAPEPLSAPPGGPRRHAAVGAGTRRGEEAGREAGQRWRGAEAAHARVFPPVPYAASFAGDQSGAAHARRDGAWARPRGPGTVRSLPPVPGGLGHDAGSRPLPGHSAPSPSRTLPLSSTPLLSPTSRRCLPELPFRDRPPHVMRRRATASLGSCIY